jgi:hypothetical protein
MMPHQIKNAIRAMKAEIAPSKTGLVRALLPEIEDALAAGYKVKSVWERIAANGVEITYTQFCLYLQRVRKATADTAHTHGKKSGLQVRRVKPEGSDPLHNVRLRETARPGFHYRGTQDLDFLVYGRKEDHGNQRH